MTEQPNLDWSPPQAKPFAGELTTPALPPPQKQRSKRRYLQVEIRRPAKQPTQSDRSSDDEGPSPPQEEVPLLRMDEPLLEPLTTQHHTSEMGSPILDLTMEEFQEFIVNKDPIPPPATRPQQSRTEHTPPYRELTGGLRLSRFRHRPLEGQLRPLKCGDQRDIPQHPTKWRIGVWLSPKNGWCWGTRTSIGFPPLQQRTYRWTASLGRSGSTLRPYCRRPSLT
ncbi:hypothetical protein GOODEAATRI_033885 [Goodea atripinnis]|uniref:Uncharacterized protein n=1 Tax=Goodea atripinnis TaxID=208336 RepID=A0ABV0N6H9_9TELE